MKFLLMGDFHGKTHTKLNKIKNLDFDYVLCNGDLPSDGGIREYIFKHWKELNKKSLEEMIGKKRYNAIKIKSQKSLVKVLKFLNSINKKVYLVRGNFDLEKSSRKKNPTLIKLRTRIKKYKNIKLIESNLIKNKDFKLLCHSGYRPPIEKGKEKLTFKYYTKRKINGRNKSWDKKLNKLFSKLKDFTNSIFLVHDPPLNYLDKVLYKKSPMYGKHLGDEYYLKYIKKYQPTICVCGHMHEHSKKTAKIKKTLIINPGEASKGQFAVLELKNNKYKIKLF